MYICHMRSLYAYGDDFTNFHITNIIKYCNELIHTHYYTCNFVNSKLRGTESDAGSGRMFVIEVVHIYFSKLFKGLGCAVLSMVLCIIKNPRSHSIRVGHSPEVGLPSVAIFPWLRRKRRNIHSLNGHIVKYFQFLILFLFYIAKCIIIHLFVTDIAHKPVCL